MKQTEDYFHSLWEKADTTTSVPLALAAALGGTAFSLGSISGEQILLGLPSSFLSQPFEIKFFSEFRPKWCLGFKNDNISKVLRHAWQEKNDFLGTLRPSNLGDRRGKAVLLRSFQCFVSCQW